MAVNAHRRDTYLAAPDTCPHFIAKTTDHAIAYSTVANALRKAQKYNESLEYYDKVIALTPNDPVAHNNRGSVLRELNRHDDALASFDTAIALMPRSALSHFKRGITLQDLRRYDEALASYDNAIVLAPDSVEACFNRGIVLYALRRYGEALTSYDKAIAIKHDFAGAHNNRGNALHALERHDEALASYAKAIALDPDDAAAHYNRAIILHRLKRFEEALASFDKAASLGHESAEVQNNRGMSLHALKRYDEALDSYDRAIALAPGHAMAHSNRGVILQAMRRYEDALASFSRAITLKPDFAEGYFNRGNALQEIRLNDEALENYDKAISLKVDYADAYNNRGIALQKLARYDDALASIDKVIVLRPGYAEAYNNRGDILANQGDVQKAELAFLEALALKPDYPKALYNLVHSRTNHTVDCETITYIQSLLLDPLRGDAEYLHFSLGKIYDDCKLYDEAFECYRQANQICNAKIHYDPVRLSNVTRSITETFTREFLTQSFSFASHSQQPLFIIGMPRSGTSLIASVLSNHPAIATAGELPTMAGFTLRLQNLLGNSGSYPQAAKHVPPVVASKLIDDYEKRLRRDAGPDVPYIIDKHPMNFWHLGFINMLFPQARVIHCIRHPLDTCLSNFAQCFERDYDYAFDLHNIAHYYGEYTNMMEHWRKNLPGRMIEVEYEDVVMNTEEAVRRLLDSIGVAWNDLCLSPHTNPFAVGTASRWQVRQPIYKKSVNRWQHYERHLGPLKDILQLAQAGAAGALGSLAA